MKNFILLIFICVTTSCSSYKGITSTDNNIKKVSVGMKKKKVISIMGDNYEVLAAREGVMTLGYKSPHNGIYKLVFVRDKLKEWNKEWLRGKLRDNTANSNNN